MKFLIKKINLRKILRYFKIGSFIYKLYYAPKSFLQRIVNRGIVNSFIDKYEKIQMIKASYILVPVLSKQCLEKNIEERELLEIYFLSGEKFWYQTVFCAYSMFQNSTSVSLRPIIYDDGSLSKKYQDKITRVFPNSKIVLKDEIDEQVEVHLPRHSFPYLRERRDNYPNIRKLIDIHIGSQGWKLVLDSDMLFFKTPIVLIDWLKKPTQPCYMVDVKTSYGYSKKLMSSLAQADIPERVNVGICGLKSEDLDWNEIEFWCKNMIEKQGTSYYQEQAIITMILSRKFCTILSDLDYIVMPNQYEVMYPSAVLHHYVGDSKNQYFRYGWKHILKIN